MTEAVATEVPVYQDFMNPILDILRREARALSIEELDRRVIEHMQLSSDVVSIPHDEEKPDSSEVRYRIAWARTYLKKAGLLDNPKRGAWAVTKKGDASGSIDSRAVAAEIAQAARQGRAQDANDDLEEDEELRTARVGEELGRQIRDMYNQLESAGELLPAEEADRSYSRFRSAFGPEVLGNLDGEALLQKMHGRGTRDSLVYWLEFKDDDEFSGKLGSISGGSALKFGLYQAAENSQWMTGSAQAQQRLTVEEAIAKVRSQRDQLVAGCRLLAGVDPDTADFASLQNALTAAAPDVAETSWGHKYFSLLFPDLIEPFHGEEYQKHQLRKLLKLPASGRYENARIFVGVARQMKLSLLDLATCLHRRAGSPHGYWRIGTTIDEVSAWDDMLRGGYVAVGWNRIGDLSSFAADQTGKAEIRALIERHHPRDAGTVSRGATQVFQFINAAQEGDVVLAMEGATVRGIGRFTGAYTFSHDGSLFPHRRAVEWLRVGDWKLPLAEALRTTFMPIRRDRNIIEVEARLVGATRASRPLVTDSRQQPLAVLSGIPARIDAVLQRKRQVILYGPPGTGKTHWAERAVEELAARAWFGVSAKELDDEKRRRLVKSGAIELCSFHPAYGYEDFIEGFRPKSANGALSFDLQDGVFKKLCARASSAPGKPHFLIIDEINRGDIPRIFGELLTVLEREKRGRLITLPLSGKTFSVPDNVFVIGTMNTADRSIALLDAALRRRFGFVELLPDSTTLAGVAINGLPLGPWLEELNRRIVQHVGRDARHLQVGHSYLLPLGAAVRELPRFVEILRDDIVPLLEEYCYEDFDALEKILGSGLVQRTKQRIDAALFEPARHLELMQKLLSAFEGITTTRQAVAADASVADEQEEEETEA